MRNARRTRPREEARAAGGGPSFYTVRRQRLGKALVEAVRRAHHAGGLPTTRAAVVPGLKPTQVGAMPSTWPEATGLRHLLDSNVLIDADRGYHPTVKHRRP